MSELLPADETEAHCAPRLLRIPDEFEPSPDLVPLRLTLLPSRMTLELTRPDLTVGRHSSSDVRLPLPDVSRRHCRLVFQADHWWLLDSKSLNGVFVNDERVQAKALRAGDRVRVGGFTFLVEPAEALALSMEVQRTVLGGIAAMLDDLPSDRRIAS